ncbi:MAG: hypothetical protein KF709_03900 [Gemmatimonadaceae bacterium]|nr:hypothetical protein [Gemmatimonadaceae bacterium]
MRAAARGDSVGCRNWTIAVRYNRVAGLSNDHPAHVRVNVVARVPIVARRRGRTFPRMSRVVVHCARAEVSVRRVSRGVTSRSVDLRQFLVRCIAVVNVREQRFGREDAETQSENERDVAAQ